MPKTPSCASPSITSLEIWCSLSIRAESMWPRANPRKDSRNAEIVSRSSCGISGNGKTVSSGTCPARRERSGDASDAADRGLGVLTDSSSKFHGRPVGMEPGARTGHIAQQRRGKEAGAAPRSQVFEGGENACESERVGVAQEPAAKRREAGAEEHRKVELGGGRDDIFGQAQRRLGDHREHGDGFRLVFGARQDLPGLNPEDLVGPGRRSGAFTAAVVVEAAAGLSSQPSRRRERLVYGCLEPAREGRLP